MDEEPFNELNTDPDGYSSLPPAQEPAQQWQPPQPAAPQPTAQPVEPQRAMPHDGGASYADQPPYGDYRNYQAPRPARPVVDPSLPLGPRQPMPQPFQPQRIPERRRISPWIPLVGGCLVIVAVIMALCAAGAGLIWGFSLNSESVDGTTTRTFNVSGTPTLTLHVDAADVHIVPGDSNTITATLTKSVRTFSRQQAQHDLDRITLDATQTGDTLNITVQEPSFDGPFGFINRRADLQLTVPPTVNLDATLGAGNLEVTGLTGDMTLNNSAGNVSLTNMTFTHPATIKMSAGNITATQITGALTVTEDFGNVTLHDAALTQSSTIRDSAGNVTVDGALHSGASLDVTDNAGNVELTLPQTTSAHLNATTSAGEIHVSGWPISSSSSGANATASGDLNTNPTGSITIHTDAGNITLTAS